MKLSKAYRLPLREDEAATWFGRMYMILLSIGMACIMSVLSGCVNLYTRLPFTGSTIESCYQSTDTAAALALVGSFPQAMAASGDNGVKWYNAFTITFIGLPLIADTACEAILDTVFLPADYFISESRHGKHKDPHAELQHRR